MLVASEKRIPEVKPLRNQADLLPKLCVPKIVERFVAVIPTAWGVCGAVWCCQEGVAETGSPFAACPAGARLCRLILPGLAIGELRKTLFSGSVAANEVIGDGHGNFHPEVVPDWFPELVRLLQGYYANGLRDWTQLHHANNWSFWNPRLDQSPLTPFQRDVLHVVAEIPHGQRLTYGDIAKKVGKPKASRAVGAAVGANPWPVLVPCHRVVGSGGRMTGFSAPGGVAAKKRMLAMEDPTLLFS